MTIPTATDGGDGGYTASAAGFVAGIHAFAVRIDGKPLFARPQALLR